MADTVRTYTALQTLLADNTSRAISEQDLRDFMASVMNVVPYVAKTGAYTATENDGFIACDTTSAGFTVLLPAVASTRVGKRYTIKKVSSDGNTLTLDANASETIDGSTTKTTTTQYAGWSIVNTGAAWLIEV